MSSQVESLHLVCRHLHTGMCVQFQFVDAWDSCTYLCPCVCCAFCGGVGTSLALLDADTVTCVGWGNNKDLFSVRFVQRCVRMRVSVFIGEHL